MRQTWMIVNLDRDTKKIESTIEQRYAKLKKSFEKTFKIIRKAYEDSALGSTPTTPPRVNEKSGP